MVPSVEEFNYACGYRYLSDEKIFNHRVEIAPNANQIDGLRYGDVDSHHEYQDVGPDKRSSLRFRPKSNETHDRAMEANRVLYAFWVIEIFFDLLIPESKNQC